MSQIYEYENTLSIDDVIVPPRDSNPIKLVLSAPTIFGDYEETQVNTRIFGPCQEDVFDPNPSGFFFADF